MNLYIWNDPYKVNYGGSILYVAADTLEQAREIARRAPVSEYGLTPLPGRVFGDKPLGDPDRILSLPGGECYQWQE